MRLLAALLLALVPVLGCDPPPDDSPGHDPHIQVKTGDNTKTKCADWRDCLKPTPDQFNNYGRNK